MENKDTVIILGSSRSDGNTRQIVDFVVAETGFDLIDLNDYAIGYYDYEHRNSGDDFIPLMERITADYQTLIFATPVYWYSMSAVMKTFFDRISDLLKIRKDVGRQLRGKSLAVISCSSDDQLVTGFEVPFIKSARYLGMGYIGYTHTWIGGKVISEQARLNLLELIGKVKTTHDHSTT